MTVVGVDGCPGGWLAVVYNRNDQFFEFQVHASFDDVLHAYEKALCIAVDIPIGLTTADARVCDREARQVLKPLRHTSVFPAPDPRVVDSETYEDAAQRSRLLCGKGISVQSFGIYRKVAEVNRSMNSKLQERVVEIHPEVCFWAIASGRAMMYAKRTSPGFEERRLLLTTALGLRIPGESEAKRLVRGATADDVLDAMAAAWSADRFARGLASRLPVDPPLDARGLRMEMIY